MHPNQNDSPDIAPDTASGQAHQGARRLSVGAGANLIGFGLFTLSQWGVLSVLAHLTGPEMVGMYGLGLAIVVPVFLLTNLSLRPAFATDTSSMWGAGVYIRLRVLGAIIGGAIALGAAIFIAADFQTAEGQIATPALFMALLAIMVLAKWAEAGSDMANAVFQAADTMAYVGRSLGLRGLLGAGLFALGAMAMASAGKTPDHIVLFGAAGLSAGWALVFWRVDLPAAKRLLHTDLKSRLARNGTITSLLAAVLPLGIAIFITSVQINLPRLVVERQFGLAELGLFTAIMAFYGVGTQAVNTVGQTMMTRMARALGQGQWRHVTAYTVGLATFAAAGGAALLGLAVWFGGPLLGLVYGNAFAAGADLFVAVAIVALFRFMTEALRIVLVAARRFRTRLAFEGFALSVLIYQLVNLPADAAVAQIPRAMLQAELISGAVLVVLLAGLITRSVQNAKKSRSGAAG